MIKRNALLVWYLVLLFTAFALLIELLFHSKDWEAILMNVVILVSSLITFYSFLFDKSMPLIGVSLAPEKKQARLFFVIFAVIFWGYIVVFDFLLNVQ